MTDETRNKWLVNLPLEQSLEIIDDALVNGFNFQVQDGQLIVLDDDIEH